MQQRSSGETDQHNPLANDTLHCFVQHAALRTVTLVDKDINITLGPESLRKILRNLLQIEIERFYSFPSSDRYAALVVFTAKFMDKRADQPRFGLVEHRDQLRPASDSADFLASILESAFDLFVQLVAVGDDDHTGIGDILANPLRQPHHREALARTLRMPDDTVLFAAHTRLGRFDSKILVRTRRLLDTAVKDDEVVNKLQQPVLFEELQNAAIQFIRVKFRSKPRRLARFAARLLPAKPKFFRGLDYPVMQAFGIIASTQQLHGREKSRDIFVLLIANILTNAFMNRYRAAFKFDNCHGDTVDINDQIRAAVAFTLYGNLLGNLEIILHRVRPVDKVHRLFVFRYVRLNIYAVTQQCVNLPVGIVQTRTDIRRRLFEFRYGLVDLLVGIFPSFQITAQ